MTLFADDIRARAGCNGITTLFGCVVMALQPCDWVLTQRNKLKIEQYTGHSRYVDFACLDTTTYVEVIFHSQHFFSIFLCISTPSISKMVNMKQRVSRGDFSCPRHIFYCICFCLCRSKNQHWHGHHIVCFGYIHVLAEVRTSSNQQ